MKKGLHDNDTYIINQLVLSLREAIEAYDEEYTDEAVTELGKAVKTYCKQNHLSYE